MNRLCLPLFDDQCIGCVLNDLVRQVNNDIEWILYMLCSNYIPDKHEKNIAEDLILRNLIIKTEFEQCCSHICIILRVQ